MVFSSFLFFRFTIVICHNFNNNFKDYLLKATAESTQSLGPHDLPSSSIYIKRAILLCSVSVWFKPLFTTMACSRKYTAKGPLPGLRCKRVRATWQADHGSCKALLSCKPPHATVDPKHNWRLVYSQADHLCSEEHDVSTYCTRRHVPGPPNSWLEPAGLQALLEEKHSERPKSDRSC